MKMPIAYLDVAARYVELAPHIIFRTPTVANLGSPVGLYLEQPWVGLTDAERESVLDSVPPDNLGGEYYDKEITAIAIAIEARLKEKNA
jgi:hypothetical protein